MQVSANGIAIEVEDTAGTTPPAAAVAPRGADAAKPRGPRADASGEPLLLIMGLGMQLVAWPAELIGELTARGFRVVRYDNRDIGLSQGFDHLGVPNLAWATMRWMLHLPIDSPYTLADMAADGFGVLDALGIERAHVFGVSMGGMIAQHMAALRPDRVKSVTLGMTTSGSRALPQPAARAMHALLSRPRARRRDGTDLDAIVDHFVHLFEVIGSPRYPTPKNVLRSRLAAAVTRAWRPNGSLRQMAAIAADGDRSKMLARIGVPAAIVHGAADPLVPVAAAHDLKRSIPHARLDVIDGMGHDLPAALMPRLAGLISSVADPVERRYAAAAD